MVKPEWGTKRTCVSCGARFYDMRRTPIICPKCDTQFEPETAVRGRRAAAKPVVAAKPAEPTKPPVEIEEEEEAELEPVENDDDDSGLIEDASDLGEDDDDMAEVMEHLDEDLED